jgi:hypothetical protein
MGSTRFKVVVESFVGEEYREDHAMESRVGC